MSHVTVGKWGKNLAVRVPFEIAKATGLSDGEQVEMEVRDGDILIRRPSAHARADAIKAAEEIIAERAKSKFRMSRAEILEMLHEGRRK